MFHIFLEKNDRISTDDNWNVFYLGIRRIQDHFPSNQDSAYEPNLKTNDCARNYIKLNASWNEFQKKVLIFNKILLFHFLPKRIKDKWNPFLRTNLRSRNLISTDFIDWENRLINPNQQSIQQNKFKQLTPVAMILPQIDNYFLIFVSFFLIHILQ